MRDEDFSQVAQALMRLPLFSDSSRDGGIAWSAEMIEMWLRCGCCCVYCGRNMLESYVVSEFDAQADHLLPKSQYQELKDEPFNWVLSCSACNKLKLTRNPNEHGEPLYQSGSGKALSTADQKILIARFVEWKDTYAGRYQETFAKQKEILFGILDGTGVAKATNR